MAKKVAAKHPQAGHPAVGRLDHDFTTVSRDAQSGRTIVKKSDTCVLCGFDEAWHDLTEADYTGTPEALAAYLKATAA